MSEHAHANLQGKRLVIFGCGYVGSEVARQARAAGCRVTALTRNADKAAALRLEGIETVEANLADQGWHAQLPEGADFVLNSVSSGGGGVRNYHLSYVQGMRSVLRWARRQPVGTLVYTSSTSVYPQGGGARVDEDARTDGASETARVLLEAEEMLKQAGTVPLGARDRVLRGEDGNAPEGREAIPLPVLEHACERWFILRLAGIYGPGRHSLLDQLRGGATEIAGRGDSHLNLIYRDDIASAVLAAFVAPATVQSQVLNVADDEPAPRGELARWLAESLMVPTPSFTGVPATGRRGQGADRIISNERIKRVLGWRPQVPSFRAGYGKILSL